MSLRNNEWAVQKQQDVTQYRDHVVQGESDPIEQSFAAPAQMEIK